MFQVLVDAAARHQVIEVQARVAGALWGLSVHDQIAERIGTLQPLATPCHPLPHCLLVSSTASLTASLTAPIRRARWRRLPH